MSTSLSTQRPQAIAEFRQSFERMGGEIQKVLPSNINLAAFQRIVITACQVNPDLLAADRASLFNACLSAAKDGLLPDGRESALVVFRSRNGDRVSYMPMVAGVIKKARQSPEKILLTSHVVYESDAFDYELGDNERIYHKPTLQDRGAPIGAYAIAHFDDGTVMREVMSMRDIERVRASSRASQGPFWSNWFDEMARKTVIRRLAKRLPISSDSLISQSDDDYEAAPPAPPIVQPAPAPAPIAPPAEPTESEPPAPQPKIAKPRAPKQESATDTIDAETGEVSGNAPSDAESPF